MPQERQWPCCAQEFILANSNHKTTTPCHWMPAEKIIRKKGVMIRLEQILNRAFMSRRSPVQRKSWKPLLAVWMNVDISHSSVCFQDDWSAYLPHRRVKPLPGVASSWVNTHSAGCSGMGRKSQPTDPSIGSSFKWTRAYSCLFWSSLQAIANH